MEHSIQEFEKNVRKKMSFACLLYKSALFRLLPAPTQIHSYDVDDDEDDALEAAYHGGVRAFLSSLNLRQL